MSPTYAPLWDFPWFGGPFEVASGIRIEKTAGREFADDFLRVLFEGLQDEIRSARHTLEIDDANALSLPPSAVVQLFLFALWLAKPTKTHVSFRFAAGGSGAHLLEPFKANPKSIAVALESNDLVVAKDLLPLLGEIEVARRRLRHALWFSIRGREAHTSIVSLLCMAAAAEALLNCDDRHDVTKRLAKRFACLVETEPTPREAAYCRFKSLYGIRSDLLHGRRYLPRTGDENLAELADFEDALRTLWLRVLHDPHTADALEQDDAERQVFFNAVVDGFRPSQP